MRLILFLLLTAFVPISAANAQSIVDNLPEPQPVAAPGAVPPAPTQPAPQGAPSAVASAAPAASYTVTDVNADVTADTAAHARDQALTQAEHAAFAQLCARMGAPDSAATISDDAVAALVQSFDVQSEQLSAVRYIGVFTIHFDPAATRKALGSVPAPLAGDDAGQRTAAIENAAHLQIAVQTPSLAAWAQTKNRLAALPQVVRIDTLDLGRGLSHIDMLYSGSVDALKSAMTAQGLVLQQASDGAWQLVDTGAR